MPLLYLNGRLDAVRNVQVIALFPRCPNLDDPGPPRITPGNPVQIVTPSPTLAHAVAGFKELCREVLDADSSHFHQWPHSVTAVAIHKPTILSRTAMERLCSILLSKADITIYVFHKIERQADDLAVAYLTARRARRSAASLPWRCPQCGEASFAESPYNVGERCCFRGHVWHPCHVHPTKLVPGDCTYRTECECPVIQGATVHRRRISLRDVARDAELDASFRKPKKRTKSWSKRRK